MSIGCPHEHLKTQLCVRVLERVRDRPDFAGGIAEDRGSKALSNTNQAGPINLHYEVIHLDPTYRDTKRTLYAERCLEKTKVSQWTYFILIFISHMQRQM